MPTLSEAAQLVALLSGRVHVLDRGAADGNIALATVLPLGRRCRRPRAGEAAN